MGETHLVLSGYNNATVKCVTKSKPRACELALGIGGVIHTLSYEDEALKKLMDKTFTIVYAHCTGHRELYDFKYSPTFWEKDLRKVVAILQDGVLLQIDVTLWASSGKKALEVARGIRESVELNPELLSEQYLTKGVRNTYTGRIAARVDISSHFHAQDVLE